MLNFFMAVIFFFFLMKIVLDKNLEKSRQMNFKRSAIQISPLILSEFNRIS